MVIKRGLTSKIFFLFFSGIMITFCMVLISVMYTLKDVSRDEVYFRLNAYCDITANDWENGTPIIPSNDSDYNYGIIQGVVEGDIEKPTNIIPIEDYSKEEFMTFLNKVDKDHGVIEEGNDIYFYIIKHSKTSNHFVMMIVNDSYSIDFTQRVVVIISLIFSIAILLLAFLFSGWINKFIKRIKKLQEHVKTMNKEKYESEYLDSGDDEIADLSQSIEDMRLEIKRVETTKRDILQNVSHDLKTPIAVIKNYAEAIEDGVATEDGARIILKQAEILKSKVNQLLQYNRLEFLSSDLEFENVNLKDICLEVINNYKLGTDILFEYKLEDCYFKGFRENFNTIIENIVDNALRYAKTKIVIITKKNKITIYNDGEYIEEQFLSGNFKPYEKGSKGQFGLGMSIVKKTLDFFGLNLSVYNEKQGGVSFVISSNEK